MSLLNWKDTINGLPDAGITVFVAQRQAAEPVWLGYWDGEKWMTVEGAPAGEVVKWAPMVRGPLDTGPVTQDEMHAAMRLMLCALPVSIELNFFWRDGAQHLTSVCNGIPTTCELVRSALDQPGVIRPTQVH